MKVQAITTVFELLVFLVIIKTSASTYSVHIEKFISHLKRTVTFIVIDDDAINDELFQVKESSPNDFITFKVQSEMLENCEQELIKINEIRNASLPIEMNKFRELQTFESFNELQRSLNCDTVIVSSSLHLDSILKCLVNSHGTFLIYLTDNKTTFDEEDFMLMLKRTWTENGALKVFLSIGENVFSFNPFHRNHNGILGKLDFHTELSINIENEKKGKMKNLNGYPMNVEMFSGTFSFTQHKDPKRVGDFTGPDANAASFIREQLNATSKLESFERKLLSMTTNIYSGTCG